MPTCAEGHVTEATDYCTVCGSPVTARVTAPDPSRTAATVTKCPACGISISGRYGESCGHDSALPEPAARSTATGTSVEWTAVVTADKEYHKRVIARGGPDTVDFPEVFPDRRIVLQDSTLIGRNNRKQGVEPGIDLGIHPIDRGVSTQHAVLQIRDSGLTITDLGSTNGTSLNDSDDLLGNGKETALSDGDRIHVGAWTTITVTRSDKAGP
jgi:hypothetical protein